MQKRTASQNGFTLVELMVVVTIIGILSAIAIPRVFSYIRTSATAEVAQDGGMIVGAVVGYAESQQKTPASVKTEMDGTTVTPDSSGSNELAQYIPQFQLPRNGNFNYAVSAIVATAGPASGEVVFCIMATGRPTSAVSGGKVLYSSSPSSAQGWDGRVNRLSFVNGQTTLTGVTAGGYCSEAGVAQATCTGCG